MDKFNVAGMPCRSLEDAVNYAGRVYEHLVGNPHLRQESRDQVAREMLQALARQVSDARVPA